MELIGYGLVELLYKVLGAGGSPCHGGHGTWRLPANGQPGQWMPLIQGKLIPCERGYHLCRPQDLLHWLGPALYEAEYQGERIDSGTKVVVRRARLLRCLSTWNEVSARLFACDCAEHVLPLFEHRVPGDDRVRRCIEVARRYACIKATSEELAAARAAARDAAWDAAGDAGDAAWDAARAAAGAAAWAAARDAAWDAARDAAWAAAGAAEREWQREVLMGYLYPREGS